MGVLRISAGDCRLSPTSWSSSAFKVCADQPIGQGGALARIDAEQPRQEGGRLARPALGLGEQRFELAELDLRRVVRREPRGVAQLLGHRPERAFGVMGERWH